MNALADQPLDRNRKGATALSNAEIAELSRALVDWNVVQVGSVPQLSRAYRCKNFAEALQLTNQIGALAEAEDHHPALLLEWGKVTVSWWTHSVGGLHLNDFIMAARCDQLATVPYSGNPRCVLSNEY